MPRDRIPWDLYESDIPDLRLPPILSYLVVGIVIFGIVVGSLMGA